MAGKLSDMAEVRRRSWITRRAKYGPGGHSGSYSRRAIDRIGARALALVVRLHREATLSEGQCCKALGLDRIGFRSLADQIDAGSQAVRETSNAE